MKKLWRKFNKSIVTNTLFAVGTRIAIVISLLTTVSYFHIYSQIADTKLAELQSYTQERGARESQIFQLAQDNHQLLKQDLLRNYTPEPTQHLLSTFNQQFTRNDDGAIRNFSPEFDADESAGFWLAADTQLTDDIKARAILFNKLVTQYGKSWRNRFINTYAIGPEHFASIYWPEIPDFVTLMDANFDIGAQEYFAIATAANNPQRKTVWTGVYRDAQSDIWMVSIETPIYYQNRHIATIGNDMALDELFQRTMNIAPEGGFNLMFREDGRLIAHADYIAQLKATDGNFNISQHGDEQLKNIYQAVINNTKQASLINVAAIDSYLLVTKIKGPDWYYVTVIPKVLISNIASGTAAIVFIFGVIALIFELLVLCYVMKRKITWPLVQLNRATLALARGYEAKPFDGLRQDELGRLARSFNIMKQHLTKRDQQLAHSAQTLALQLTQLQNSQHAMQESEQLFRNAFNHSPISMAIVNLDGKILQANEKLCKTFDYNQNEIIELGFIQLVHPDERHLSNERLSAIVNDECSTYDAERAMICKDGTKLFCYINVFVQRDTNNKPDYAFIQCLDITDRKHAESKLNQLAFHDPLTNLANRTLFIEFLTKAIMRFQRDEQLKFALLFLDLDGFKLVNDSLGHLEGDKLLIAITARLRKELRNSDTLARFGGDEFCILLNDINDKSQVVELAKRINKTLSKPFELTSEAINTNASIGIIVATPELNDAQEYLRDADSAMYQAKKEGRGRYAIYNTTMHRVAKRQLRLRNELNVAIERHELIPFYQPIINIESGRICGFEALVRWQHPKRGMLAPAQFLSVLEEMHRIADIDHMIIDAALAQIAVWRKQFKRDDLSISCNSSSDLLSTYHVVEKIEQLLTKHNLPAHCLNIEITESVLITDPETTLAVLDKLKSLGINIHLDDFGTGYSSLSYLHRFPIHNIKIDRSFIGRILNSSKDHAIVESIVLLANRLGITVTAEGVEHAEQYDRLEQIGVNRTQGYYHAKPLSIDCAATMLAEDPLTLFSNADA